VTQNSQQKRLRVVVVDDSPVARSVLTDLLERENDIRVVGEAADGERALEVVRAEKPDLATIDIQMPGVGGLEAIERIMAECPVPILVVTGQPTGPGGDLVFQAVRRGALDLAEKPGGSDQEGAALRAHVRRLAVVPVVRHVAGRLQQGTDPPRGRIATPVAGVPTVTAGPTATHTPTKRKRVVAIGASAGGPKAVAAVLAQLPADFPLCVAVVQHLPSGFAASFARFLEGVTRMRVQLVDRALDAQPGTVYVAPDNKHLVVTSAGCFVGYDGNPYGGHKPSVSVLFRSVAEVFGAAAIGVVLTGIGNDGTTGMQEMKLKGALTIAQDETTSAVYGMPKAARESGCVDRVLALPYIGPALIRAAGPGGQEPG
jgi:two-component system chemotaxis response regulator CheB